MEYISWVKTERQRRRNHDLPKNRRLCLLSPSENTMCIAPLLSPQYCQFAFSKLCISQGFGEDWAENQEHDDLLCYPGPYFPYVQKRENAAG